MLIAFSVQNFKSIRDLQTLSLEARNDDHLAWSNVINDGKLRLVKSAAVFGPNASGKSNLIQAMIWFRKFIMKSSNDGQVGDPIPITPFLLSTETEKSPTHFEIEFRWEGFDYRYGFEVNSKEVQSEWLFRKSPTAKEAKLYARTKQKFDVSAANFKEGKGLEERTRPNALFLSVCAHWNGVEAVKIMQWMRKLRNVSGLTQTGSFTFTADMLQDDKKRKLLLEFAQKADFSIHSLRSEFRDSPTDTFPERKPKDSTSPWTRDIVEEHPVIMTTHLKRDKNDQVIGHVESDLRDFESSGTQKFIALCGPILHTLEEGSILLCDELDARLHPRLTQAIVDLFHSPANQKNAQLICATHDVTLLDSDRFRRDQVWFCEKASSGATELFTLADIDSNLVRPTSKFSKQYMLGLFGAVPQLAHFQEAVSHAVE